MRKIAVICIAAAFSLLAVSCEKEEIKRVEVKKTREMLKDERYDFKSVKNFEEAAKTNLKKLFENDAVAFYELNLKAGEAIPEHTTGERVFYSITNSNVSFRLPAADLSYEFAPGAVKWQDNSSCSIENAGTQDAKFLVCERKNSTIGQNTVVNSGYGGKILFANEAFVVNFVDMDAGERIPSASSGHRLIYPLNKCNVSIKGRKISTPDSAYWFEPGDYDFINRGGNAQLLIIDIKK